MIRKRTTMLKYFGYIWCAIALFVLAISNYAYIFKDGTILGFPVFNVKDNIAVAFLLFPGVIILLLYIVIDKYLIKSD